MKLGELLSGLPHSEISDSDATLEVKGVALDSREVKRGDLFLAFRGAKASGENYISDAVARGAVAIASEERVTVRGVTAVKLSEIRRHAGTISSRVYGDPSRKLTLVGVTGTNGKTTTALLLEALFRDLFGKAGYLGTIAYRWDGFSSDAPRTTPEAPAIQRMLKEMVEAGVVHAVIECSSHGMEMGRLNAVALDAAIFTNLTQDHLDFHKSMKEYREAKEKLFQEVLAASPKAKKTAILNLDDECGAKWSKKFRMSVLTYSHRHSNADVFADNVNLTAEGIFATFRYQGTTTTLRSPLIGEHNLYNLMAAFSAAVAMGIDSSRAAQALGKVASVPGRLERVPNSQGIHVLVDYAHTDDALINVMRAVAPFVGQGRMIVVFGCGGDRDKTKRPKMGKAVTEMADVAVITSDNPRSENPESIVREVERGVAKRVRTVAKEELSFSSRNVVCSIVNRKEAIEKSLQISVSGDIVLIAGKGHETYQEVAGQTYPFDDRKVARSFFERDAA